MINIGSVVKVHYTGTMEGEVFDTSVDREPIEFTVGNNEVIVGFEQALLGKNIGDEVTTVITPENGYGEVKSDLIIEVVKDQVPNDVEVGQILQGINPEGQPFNVKVSEIKDDVVLLDANHPLAGKVLEFTIDIISIQ